MNRAIRVVLLGLACAAAGWLAHQYGSLLGLPGAGRTGTGASASRADAGAEEKKSVVGMGRIEPADGVIDVGATMGDRLGHILEKVKEGAQVEEGQPLAELESRPLRKLELDAAAGQLKQAEARLAAEAKLAEVKIALAQLGVKKAEAAGLTTAAQEKKIDLLTIGVELARKDQKRLGGLSKDLVTDQERERQALLVRQAESELESAQAMMDQWIRTNHLALDAANLDLAAAEAAGEQLAQTVPIASLRAQRDLAKAQYERTAVVAPCSGKILKIFVRPGETIGGKPILQLADVKRMVVVAEVYENEVKDIAEGQAAVVTSKAFQSPYDSQGLKGKVVWIGKMIASPSLRSVDPFAPADRHVAEVRVELDEESSQQAARLTNLQVDVRFIKRD
jgi:HlyD family secretion protein